MTTSVSRPPRRNWPEYWREAAGLGIFMLSASCFGTLLELPNSPVRQAVPDAFTRRGLMGLAMAFTAAALIYSPWGRQSGAHYNPAVTLTFYRLGKVAPRDLAGYVAAQFVGGILGTLAAWFFLGDWLANRAVNFVATVPGMYGIAVAFTAEVFITMILMVVVLSVSNSARFARFTGVCAAVCVALFITFEAPLSGMSLNPARSFASAFVAGEWTALWIYFVAPPIGMLLAVELYRWAAQEVPRACAKLEHRGGERCIFCEYQRK
jgi:aquaporin Z